MMLEPYQLQILEILEEHDKKLYDDAYNKGYGAGYNAGYVDGNGDKDET